MKKGLLKISRQQRFINVSTKNLGKIKSPLDSLNLTKGGAKR